MYSWCLCFEWKCLHGQMNHKHGNNPPTGEKKTTLHAWRHANKLPIGLFLGFGYYWIIPCARIMAVIPFQSELIVWKCRFCQTADHDRQEQSAVRDLVWTTVWGIPPADRHSWRSRSVFFTRTQLWINWYLSSSNQSDPFRSDPALTENPCE